jgi:hypothetical protein
VTDAGATPAIRAREALSDLGWFALNALPRPLTRATEVAVAHLHATHHSP